MVDSGKPFLGCIADDVTGATDLASNLVLGGMKTVQVFGVPELHELQGLCVDAIVVALKSRSVSPDVAIEQSINALRRLRDAGVKRFFFKYCSTFDSTIRGNIGPVAEAMIDELGIEQTIFCPAFPRNGRTVYQGHLFVGDRLLNESGMENHPLNPMSDANLVRFLGRQSERGVGLIPSSEIESGQVQSCLKHLRQSDRSLAIVDACSDDHLRQIASQVVNLKLVTGGSGIARYLPIAWRSSGAFSQGQTDREWARLAGRMAILAGSCSLATQRQVQFLSDTQETFFLDVKSLIEDREGYFAGLVTRLRNLDDSEPIVVYSSSSAEQVQSIQATHGAQAVAHAIESVFAELAEILVQQFHVRKLILAGGETSGAVTQRLGVRAVRIGSEICPGVPRTQTLVSPKLDLVLKSGNFGEENFFVRAMELTR